MSQRQSSLGTLEHSSKALLSWLLHTMLYLMSGMLSSSTQATWLDGLVPWSLTYTLGCMQVAQQMLHFKSWKRIIKSISI